MLKIKLKNKKWKRRDIIMLLERLEMYLSSGLEINKALQISEEGLLPKQKISIQKLRLSVESGNSLFSGLEKFVHISKTTSGLIEHGELSGSLSKSLLTARLLLEKEDELFKKCTSAMVYPVVIGIFAGLLTIGLVRGVMSQIIPMLKSLHVQLPLVTKIVIYFSEILTKYGLHLFVGTIIALIISRIILRKYLVIRKFFQLLIIKIPIVGRLFYNYYLAVFLHSCGALVESGLSVKEAYSGTANTIQLIPLNQFLHDQIIKISRGLSLGTVIVHKDIPSYITALLNAGEASGTLGLSIIRAGNILDREIDHSLKRLTALIEPIMMVGMGCIVGAIALSIMMPIYNISGALQK
ncbi:MAG: type II secretion system F family protein [Candidatus Paceibacterota bacterium]